MNNQIDQSQPAEESVAQAKQVSSSPFSKHLPFILVALVAALLASTGTYLALKQSNTKPQNLPQTIPSPTPIPDLTSNWKTYSNDEFGFELKYPSNWQAYTSGVMISLTAPQGEAYWITLGSLIDLNGKSIEQISLFSPEDTVLSRKELTVNDHLTVIRTASTPSSQYESGPTEDNLIRFKIFALIQKKENQAFQVEGYSKQVSNEEFQQIFNQILSTFKFTDPDQTPISSITVLSPNGGERWIRGNTHDIKWESRGEITRVNIILYNKNTSAYVINVVTDYPNTGMYRWKIPLEPHAPIVDYGIEVRESRTGSLYVADGSDGLFIIQSP